MITSIIRRLIQALFVIVAMTVIVFIGVNVIGNPVDILIRGPVSEKSMTVLSLVERLAGQ